MTLRELCERAAEHGLKVVQIHQLRPVKIALVDEVERPIALINEDGVPLFTIEEAAALLEKIDLAGGFDVWIKRCEADEEDEEDEDEADGSSDSYAAFSETNSELRHEIRVVVLQGLLRHKLISSFIPFDDRRGR